MQVSLVKEARWEGAPDCGGEGRGGGGTTPKRQDGSEEEMTGWQRRRSGERDRENFLLEGVDVPFQTGATNTVKQAGVTLSPSERATGERC